MKCNILKDNFVFCQSQAPWNSMSYWKIEHNDDVHINISEKTHPIISGNTLYWKFKLYYNVVMFILFFSNFDTSLERKMRGKSEKMSQFNYYRINILCHIIEKWCGFKREKKLLLWVIEKERWTTTIKIKIRFKYIFISNKYLIFVFVP